ncbi:MAG: D-alanyl-D-alanine carboxypeptidase family protein [Christensenella sp.]|uniref:D-alanyl-D-alanine carboxypeptidase family protein n=1 Tax=Christensenella sp. TaxID=1935934 RepID=UPI002B1F7E52|nr:D-alanyl-D-alanine carboxypeptidase family protein [Christensenella sp.]MEA5002442.1 D-alanyl-D-alanine carboxypeptidase family protein [Christensenella sp.]
MKKIVTWIIAVVLIVAIPVVAFAAPEAPASGETAASGDAASPEATPTPIPTPEPTATPEATSELKQGSPEVDMSKITADSVMLIDADTGEVLFSKNKDWRVFPASTTKLMTAILTLENCNMEDMVTVGAEVDEFSKGSSLMGLRRGETISVKDLFYGLMICSGNDAAAALGVHMAGSESAFVEMMNQKAQEMGMTGTHFLNPYGLYIFNIGYDHYTTAADMSILSREAYKHTEIAEAAKMKEYTPDADATAETPRKFTSSNFLIATPENKPEYSTYLYDKATGLKTGLLENITLNGGEAVPSYGCLVATATSGDLNLIALIFGDKSLGDKAAGIPNSYARWDIAKYLFEYGFANYAKVDLTQYVAPLSVTEQIEGAAGNDPEEGKLEVTADLSGEKTEVRLVDATTAQGLADGSVQLEQQTNIEEPLKAPINAGDKVGTVSYLFNGEEIYNAPLVASRQVYPAGDEMETSQEYGVPVISFEMWYLWIIIPAGLVLTLIIVRTVNISRRKRRYAGARRGADISPVRAGRTAQSRSVPTRAVKTRRPDNPGGRKRDRDKM